MVHRERLEPLGRKLPKGFELRVWIGKESLASKGIGKGDVAANVATDTTEKADGFIRKRSRGVFDHRIPACSRQPEPAPPRLRNHHGTNTIWAGSGRKCESCQCNNSCEIAWQTISLKSPARYTFSPSSGENVQT